MSNIFEFNGFRPVIHETAFIHPNATVTGNVVIGRNVYVGPGAALRGDWGEIIIEDGCNVQENCTIHMFPGTTVVLKEGAHIGHGAVIHGAVIGKNALVGMNSVVLDDAEVGDGCIVGALTLVPAEMKTGTRKVLAGSPARVVKEVTDEMLAWKTRGTQLYQQLPDDCRESLRPCEPLRRVPAFRKSQSDTYSTWKKQTRHSAG